jgi:hypothetical protein
MRNSSDLDELGDFIAPLVNSPSTGPADVAILCQ